MEGFQLALPEGFQRSEFLLDHGAIDVIVERHELRDRLHGILSKLMYSENVSKANKTVGIAKDTTKEKKLINSASSAQDHSESDSLPDAKNDK